MSPDQIEALFRQQLAMLPPPAGIPPASANPKLHEAAQQLMQRIVEIMLKFGFVSPTIPTPPPSGPLASMDAADLQVTP
jgi:predicted Zn-dependent peptidase